MKEILQKAWSTLRSQGPLEAASRSYWFISSKIKGKNMYQEPIARRIRKLSKNHKSYIDIGAADGELVRLTRGLFKEVLAIEPAPHHAKKLEKLSKKGLLGNVEILKCAIGSRNGKAKLGLSDSNPDDNSLFKRTDINKFVIVPLKTLDTIISQRKISKPVLIKMDVQGYEGQILKGAKKILEDGRCTIIMEYWPWGLTRAGTEPEVLVKNLKDLGFSVRTLADRNYPQRRWRRLAKLGTNNPSIVSDMLITKGVNNDK